MSKQQGSHENEIPNTSQEDFERSIDTRRATVWSVVVVLTIIANNVMVAGVSQRGQSHVVLTDALSRTIRYPGSHVRGISQACVA